MEDIDVTGIPITEQPNPAARRLDRRETLEVVQLMNQEDQKVAQAVASQLERVAKLADAFARSYASGGRIFYVGSGTSGRLGVLDAVECLPTFGVPPGRIEPILAGGMEACFSPREVQEDDRAAGEALVAERGMGRDDLVIGITASGETPFVLGCLEKARAWGCATGAVTSNPGSSITRLADLPIVVLVGPEVVAGSTRLKSGTAQKLVLNMVSTAAMVRLGKVYEGFMVDVVATNRKLRARAARILMTLTGRPRAEVVEALRAAEFRIKPALVMLKGRVTYTAAQELLEKNKGHVRAALEALGVGNGDGGTC